MSKVINKNLMLNKKIGIVSLGCPKNTSDTEYMMGLMDKAGYEITFDTDEANICLVNTCSFIADARKESVRTIVELAELGKEIVIAGCMATHFKDELLKEIPEARAIIGTNNILEIVDILDKISSDSDIRISAVSEKPYEFSYDSLPRIFSNIGSSAYLKIAEGCNHTCSFCIIPMLRGKFRSRSLESLVNEAKQLVESGIKEIILISQDSSFYGLDLYGKMALPQLLNELNEIDGLEWIRIMYFYPSEVNVPLLKTINKLAKVVKYVDIPLQHSHNDILKAMVRPLNPEATINLIREHIEDVKIRSTFIVGFPGEKQHHYEHLLDFVNTQQFNRLGVFTYSQELEVPSGSMTDQISSKIKKQRQKEIMLCQKSISYELNNSLIGKNIKVLIENYDETKNIYTGRSQWDAPQVDGLVYFKNNNDLSLSLGEFANVNITQVTHYDLIGNAI